MRVRYPGGASGGGKLLPVPNIGVIGSSSSSGAPPSSTRAVPLIDSHGVNGPVGGHERHRHARITPDVAELLIIRQMGGDQLIIAVVRALHHDPNKR